jgi:hypothetical protein
VEEEEVPITMQVETEEFLVELVEWGGQVEIQLLIAELTQILMEQVEMAEEVKFGILGLS